MYDLSSIHNYTDEQTTESIGKEYSTLDVELKRLLLINNMNMFNMLSDSNSIRDYINASNVATEVPPELILIIILSTNDVETLISYYNTSKHYREFIDSNLMVIIDNVLNSSTRLPVQDKGDYLSMYLNQIKTFSDFINFYYGGYNRYYYSCARRCPSTLASVCFSSALSKGDSKGAEVLLERIRNSERLPEGYENAQGWYGFHGMKLGGNERMPDNYSKIPVEHIEILLNSNPGFDDRERSLILLEVIRTLRKRCDLTQSEVEALYKIGGYNSEHFRASVPCDQLFRVINSSIYNNTTKDDYIKIIKSVPNDLLISPESLLYLYEIASGVLNENDASDYITDRLLLSPDRTIMFYETNPDRAPDDYDKMVYLKQFLELISTIMDPRTRPYSIQRIKNINDNEINTYLRSIGV